MKRATIDNSADVGHCLLWQYDRADKMVAATAAISGFSKAVISDFWDSYMNNHLDIDMADEFGVGIIGTIVGVPRPFVTYTVEGVSTRTILSVSRYRKFIKGYLYLYRSNFSVAALNEFCRLALDGRAFVSDGLDMSMTYNLVDEGDSEITAIFFDTNPGGAFEALMPYPAAVKTNSAVREWEVFGLNDTQTSGQNAGNFDNSTFYGQPPSGE